MAPLREQLQTAGVETKSFVSANALAADLHLDQVGIVQQLESAEVLELDPLLQVTAMDDTVADVERETFAQNHPGIDGTGVRVAVLDSGVDEQHSFLNVAASVETCNESVDIPGSHGTHCAGSIASTDALFPGIAPGATLLNVKRLRSWL